MIKRVTFGLVQRAPRLRVAFSNKKPEEDSGREPRPRFDRSSQPELSEFDRLNMEEIKKQTRDTTEPFKVQPRDSKLLKDRPTKLNLKQFELLKENEMPSDSGLNRPKGVLDFMDNRFEGRPGILQVNGLFKNSINVGGINIHGGVIVLSNIFFTWDIMNASDIRPHHFDLLTFIKPRPSRLPSDEATLSWGQGVRRCSSTSTSSTN